VAVVLADLNILSEGKHKLLFDQKLSSFHMEADKSSIQISINGFHHFKLRVTELCFLTSF
jgi:hypothetical protein